MTGPVVATAHWSALDREGEDRCRLSQASHGWLLVGHARFRDRQGFAALDYVLRCDPGWRTLGADIAGLHAGREVRLRVHREAGRWWVDEEPQPGVDGATDLDLSFSPATSIMPMRRLFASKQTGLEVSAAWLDYPCGALCPLDQTYARTGQPDIVSCHAAQTGYSTSLTVDRSGFVTLHPKRWEGTVEHAG